MMTWRRRYKFSPPLHRLLVGAYLPRLLLRCLLHLALLHKARQAVPALPVDPLLHPHLRPELLARALPRLPHPLLPPPSLGVVTVKFPRNSGNTSR